MKKLFIILIVLVLVGCGNTKEETKKEEIKNDTIITDNIECNMDQIISFKIILDTNGGNKIDTIEYLEIKDDILPTPKKDKYKFVGWFYDKNLKSEVKAKKLNELIVSKEIDSNGCITKYNDLTFVN